jgi:hypothetical protein
MPKSAYIDVAYDADFVVLGVECRILSIESLMKKQELKF